MPLISIWKLQLKQSICPKLVTKREERENPESLKKARIMGVVEAVLGIVLIIATVMMA